MYKIIQKLILKKTQSEYFKCVKFRKYFILFINTQTIKYTYMEYRY